MSWCVGQGEKNKRRDMGIEGVGRVVDDTPELQES